VADRPADRAGHLPAAAQYFFWEHFRLPFGATFLCAALLVGEWIDRYVNFWGWTFYPINLVWPTSLIPQALFLDIVLLLSRSFIVTAIVGSMGFSLLLYPNNWVILAQFHQPTEQYGTLMSLADVIGFHNVRTSMPEYIRIIERGTMRTFGKDVVGVAAFFSGFVSIIVYFVWWYVGKMFSTTKYAYSFTGGVRHGMQSLHFATTKSLPAPLSQLAKVASSQPIARLRFTMQLIELLMISPR
jgi:methane/ammonia monooxygenase subunit A